jgi:hypothetical protein
MLICCLFNDAVNSSEYRVSNCRTTPPPPKKKKRLENIWQEAVLASYTVFIWIDWVKLRQTYIRRYRR